MRKLGLAVAFAIGLVMSFAGLAKADIILTSTNTTSDLAPLTLNSQGKGSSTYDFTIAGTSVSELTASFTSSSTKKIQAITNFSLSLVSKVGDVVLQTITAPSFVDSSGTTYITLDFANFLKAGDYYLKLIVNAGRPGATVSGNVTISPVPVPAALPLFGTVLVGLMAFQARRRNRFNS
jgi:hypothetical protein